MLMLLLELEARLERSIFREVTLWMITEMDTQELLLEVLICQVALVVLADQSPCAAVKNLMDQIQVVGLVL
jgi:hypothetical protein